MAALRKSLGDQLKVSENDGVVTEANFKFTKDGNLKGVEVALNSDGDLAIVRNVGQKTDAIIKQVAAKLNTLLPLEEEDPSVEPNQSPAGGGKPNQGTGAEWTNEDEELLKKQNFREGRAFAGFTGREAKKEGGGWVLTDTDFKVKVGDDCNVEVMTENDHLVDAAGRKAVLDRLRNAMAQTPPPQ